MDGFVEFGNGERLPLKRCDGIIVGGGNSVEHSEDFVELRFIRKAAVSLPDGLGYDAVVYVLERDEFEHVFHSIRQMMGREWWAPRSGH
jgi:hypothetical protein